MKMKNIVCLQEYVCGEKDIPCSWGRAINVANRYVYVTQPEKDRILVISKIQMVVVDVRTCFFTYYLLIKAH